MRTAAAMLLLSVATASSAAEPCRIPLVAEMKVAPAGTLIQVEASIRGQPIPMIVDTGSPVTTIDRATAEKLGLELRNSPRVRAHGTGGELRVFNVTAPDFVLGTGRFAQRDLMVIEGVRSDAHRLRIGLLGQDILGAFDIGVDLRGGHLRLYENTGCAHAPPWQAEFVTVPLTPDRAGAIRFQVKIDGHTLYAELDSGAAQTVLTWPAARKLGLAPDSPGLEPGPSMMGADGVPRRVQLYRFQSFEIESETVRNPRLGIAEMFVKVFPQTYSGAQSLLHSREPPDLYLGADWLRAHRVYVGRAVNEMHFSFLAGPIFDR